MKKSALFSTILVAAVLFTGCGKTKTANRLEAIKAAGKIAVYTNPTFPPYQYLGPNKEIVGAEIDIVKKIAEKIGVRVEIVSAEFDSILGTVNTGKADMGASGFTINEERKKMVDFSIPFVRSEQFIILPENAKAISIEDLAGQSIGVQTGTTGAMMLEDAVKTGIMRGTQTNVKEFNRAPDAMIAMVNGRLQGVVIDELVAISLAKKTPGYKAIRMVDKHGKGLDLPEEFGIIVMKGEKELLDVVNSVIKEMDADGSLRKTIMLHNDLCVKH